MVGVSWGIDGVLRIYGVLEYYGEGDGSTVRPVEGEEKGIKSWIGASNIRLLQGEVGSPTVDYGRCAGTFMGGTCCTTLIYPGPRANT